MRDRHLGFIFVALCTTSPAAFAQAPRSHAKAASSAVYVVSKPTLISSIVVAQAEVDSSDDVSEALSDYQYNLGRAVAVLKSHGVQIHLTNDSTVRWRDGKGVHSISAVDSGGVLYLFVAPNGKKRILRSGVQADGAILDVARELFGLAIPVPPAEGDAP